MNLITHIFLLLTIGAASVFGSAIAKENEPFLPTVKNTETKTSSHRGRGNTDVNVGEGEANGFLAASASVFGSAIAKENEPFLPTVKNAETESIHLSLRGRGNTKMLTLDAASASGAGEDRLLSDPFKNAETETSNLGHRRRTTVGEADKAGKASPPNIYEGGRKRHRQHQCDLFEGKFVYQNGCDGNPWEVTITCDKKGRNKDRRSGVTCSYFEENLVSLLFV